MGTSGRLEELGLSMQKSDPALCINSEGLGRGSSVIRVERTRLGIIPDHGGQVCEEVSLQLAC